MPSMLSVGLGKRKQNQCWRERNGLDRTRLSGIYLRIKALVFGGDVLASTDIVVAASKEKIRKAVVMAEIKGNVSIVIMRNRKCTSC
jgi:hypothetical protein